MRIVLMGLRGSGKSTLGERLARSRGGQFIDLDDRTPLVLGSRSVAEAWKAHGEDAFRVAEVRALRMAIDEDPEVLALGGGTPTAPGATWVLRATKRVGQPSPRLVYLRAPASVLRARLAGIGMAGRPSLTGADPLDEIDAVLAVRDPLFHSLADAVIEVGDLDEAEALVALERLWGV